MSAPVTTTAALLLLSVVVSKRNQQLKIPSQEPSAMKKRKCRDPDVLLKELLDDGMFQQEHRMSCPSFRKLFDLLGDRLWASPRKTREEARPSCPTKNKVDEDNSISSRSQPH